MIRKTLIAIPQSTHDILSRNRSRVLDGITAQTAAINLRIVISTFVSIAEVFGMEWESQRNWKARIELCPFVSHDDSTPGLPAVASVPGSTF